MEISFSPDLPKDLKSSDLIKSFNKTINDPSVGFFHLPEEEKHVLKSLEIYKKFKKRKDFILVGIGGSSLGPQMLVNALGNKEERNFYYLNNIDPDETFETLEKLNPETCLFYVVSKSGGTAETLATLTVIINWLNQRRILSKSFRNHMVFCTDPEKGELRTLGKKLGIEILEVPQNVGGRFCVLSSVGILPGLFSGIKVIDLLSGATQLSNEIESVANTANFLMDQYNKGNDETVLMPYSSKLRNFSDWFVQLWAESLGKEGKGLTPISSYGVTDQHSQVQLFMEGPANKVVIFLEIKKFTYDFSLLNKEEGHNFKILSPHTLSELMKAEFEGTIKAFKDAKRPFVRISLDALDEKNLGKLILFFESLTVMMAHLLKINPFNQPGVEAGKVNAYQFLESIKK
ncbi:MAG: glucose-6-phosphate isomerase [Bacteriovoracales bacterium]